MHVAHDAKEALGAGYDPRHEPQGHGTQWYYDARWHFAPPPSDKAYGAPGEGALEEERSRLQSRALLTPAALGGGVQAGAAPGVRALRTHKPPALHDTHKYAARCGSATPPQRAVGKGADTEGNLPSDKGDHYVGLDGASHKPERRADRAELAHKRTVGGLRTYGWWIRPNRTVGGLYVGGLYCRWIESSAGWIEAMSARRIEKCWASGLRSVGPVD